MAAPASDSASTPFVAFEHSPVMIILGSVGSVAAIAIFIHDFMRKDMDEIGHIFIFAGLLTALIALGDINSYWWAIVIGGFIIAIGFVMSRGAKKRRRAWYERGE